MQLKPITAIIVLLLVVASLLVSGCVKSPTSTTNQTPNASATPSTESHNATLDKLLSAYKNSTYSNKSWTVLAWEITWINSTSARVQETRAFKGESETWNYDNTFWIFPTTQAATTHLNAMNKTTYSLYSTVYPGGDYQNVTGHTPQVFKQYVWNEGNPSNISEYK